MWKFDEGVSGGETSNKSIEKEPAGTKKDKVIWSEFARIFGHEKKEPSEAVVKFVNFLKERERKVKDVIDIGCGYGRNSIFLAKEGFNVTAVDSSKEALQIMQENARKENLNIRTIVSDDRKVDVPSALLSMLQ